MKINFSAKNRKITKLAERRLRRIFEAIDLKFYCFKWLRLIATRFLSRADFLIANQWLCDADFRHLEDS